MGDSDPASWAALVVAVLAIIIAIGQVSQQYASSGQLIRLCDSVVYGGKLGLPGKGRRVWTWSQWRFRVLYDVPEFKFPESTSPVWQTSPVSSYGYYNVADYNQRVWSELSPVYQVGEASWVSFCRQIKDPCHDRVLVTLKKDDADRCVQFSSLKRVDLIFYRCPQDLPNVPVPVRLRDIIIMAYTIGMDCVEASLPGRSLSMQGAAGGLTSSNHVSKNRSLAQLII